MRIVNRLVGALTLCTALVAGPPALAQAGDAAEATASAQSDYLIGVNDLLES